MKFPLDLAGVTPGFVSEALCESHPGVRVRALRVIDSSVHGNGAASTADRVSLELEFEAGCSFGMPARMLLKTLIAEPHVPITMYENETRFFREIRPELNIETPEVYATSFDGTSGQFGIFMEDLALRRAWFPRATHSLSCRQMQTALDVMADLHASYWSSPLLTGRWNWLPTVAAGGMADVFKTESWYQHVVALVSECRIKRKALEGIGRTVEQLYADVRKVTSGPLNRGPTTLIHGDLHMANIYVLGDDQVGFIDWQLVSKGCWAQDLTYLMVTALDIESRRENEKSLLQYYLQGLKLRGVEAVPQWNHAWNLYRQSVVWGLAIGWLGCPVKNYGPAIVQANIERLCMAAVDLRTFEAIWS